MRISKKKLYFLQNEARAHGYDTGYLAGREAEKIAGAKMIEAYKQTNQIREANIALVKSLSQALDAVAHAVAEIGVIR